MYIHIYIHLRICVHSHLREHVLPARHIYSKPLLSDCRALSVDSAGFFSQARELDLQTSRLFPQTTGLFPQTRGLFLLLWALFADYMALLTDKGALFEGTYHQQRG